MTGSDLDKRVDSSNGNLVRRSTRRRASLALRVLGCVVLFAFVTVLLRLGYEILTGPSLRGAALTAVWPFLAAVVAASVALAGAMFTREQAKRTERRLLLDTLISGLNLLTRGDGSEYAKPGVIAAAIEMLVVLEHPDMAMRVLAACFHDDAIDISTVMWLLSEILQTAGHPAQLEAAELLDAISGQLCHEPAGSFSWPRSIEFRWIPQASFPARLHVLRAVLRTLISKDRLWWEQGGRQGWAVVLLHQAMKTDSNEAIQAHAAAALEILLPILQQRRLLRMQSEDEWVSVEEVANDIQQAPRKRGRVVMLNEPMQELSSWASRVVSSP
jgi:hypothetical protein